MYSGCTTLAGCHQVRLINILTRKSRVLSFLRVQSFRKLEYCYFYHWVNSSNKIVQLLLSSINPRVHIRLMFVLKLNMIVDVTVKI